MLVRRLDLDYERLRLFEVFLDGFLLDLSAPSLGLAPLFEKHRLGHDGVVDRGVPGVAEIVWKADPGRVGLLGLQSRQFRDEANAPDLERPQAGARSCILQLDQGLPGRNLVALLNEQSAHHAAFKMADGLSLRIDDDRAVRDRRAAEFGRKRPGKKSTEGHQDRGDPRDDKTAERRAGIKLFEFQVRGAQRYRLMRWQATLGKVGADRKRLLLRHIAATSRRASPGIVAGITSVRGPNCVTRPFSSTSSLSATCMMAGL